MAYVDDPFDAMPLGPGIPAGWSTQGLLTNCIVLPFSAGGLYLPHNFGSVIFGPLITNTWKPVSANTFFVGFQITPGTQSGWNITGAGPNLTLTGDVQVFQLIPEADQSLTVRAGSGGESFLCNTGVNGWYFQFGVWYFAQINIVMGQVIVAGVEMLKVDTILAIAGNAVASGSAVTNTPASRYGSFGMWDCSFNAPEIGGMYISQLTIQDYTAIDDYPTPGSPNIRISQSLIEPAYLPTSGNVRISQALNEVARLPNTANVRISQAVIELATIYQPVTGGSWTQVYEA